jgi:hypothetical protein
MFALTYITAIYLGLPLVTAAGVVWGIGTVAGLNADVTIFARTVAALALFVSLLTPATYGIMWLLSIFVARLAAKHRMELERQLLLAATTGRQRRVAGKSAAKKQDRQSRVTASGKSLIDSEFVFRELQRMADEQIRMADEHIRSFLSVLGFVSGPREIHDSTWATHTSSHKT